MNMNRLITMLLMLFTRQAMRQSRRRMPPRGPAPGQQPRSPGTPDSQRDTARRMSQTARLLRRIGR